MGRTTFCGWAVNFGTLIMIKAIIFDTDGMVTSGELLSARLAKEYGISIETTSSFFNGTFKQCILGKCDLKKELGKHVKEWGWKKSIDELVDYWLKSSSEVDKQLVNEIEFLKRKGIKCFLGTNQENYRTDYLLNEMGFTKIFDKVFSSAHLGYKKPQREFFDKMMEQLPNIGKDEILFWDDTKENVAAAKEFGFHTELYTNIDDFRNKVKKYCNL